MLLSNADPYLPVSSGFQMFSFLLINLPNEKIDFQKGKFYNWEVGLGFWAHIHKDSYFLELVLFLEFFLELSFFLEKFSE